MIRWLLEEEKTPFVYCLMTFFSILIARSFIESFTQQQVNYLNYASMDLLYNLLHFYLAFTSGAISLILLCYVATRVDVIKIMKVVLPFYAIILLGPLIDYINSGGVGSDMGYLDNPDLMPSHNLALSFLYFFGKDPSITLGMRVETVIAIIASFSYFMIKGRHLIFSICYAILVYALIFFYCAATMFIHYVFEVLGYPYIYSSVLMARFFLVLIVPTGVVLLYLVNKGYFVEIVKDMRWLRLSYYLLLMMIGCAFAITGTHGSVYQKIFQDNPAFIINFIFSITSIIFSAIFSIVMNNVSDQGIDRITNRSRPLITGKIPLNAYLKIGYGSLALALTYALAAGVKPLFLIMVVIANYYIYSMPPIRFKRVLVFSKLVISVNSLAMVFLGYILLQGDLKFFPNIIIPIMLAGLTIMANFIDIKDDEGDKAEGVMTLPGLLGLRLSKLIMGIAFLFTYTSFSLLPDLQPYFWLFLGCGLVQFYLINKKTYEENQVFVFGLLSMMTFFGILIS